MKAYLDASVLVSLFCTDAHTGHARSALEPAWSGVLVSDFATADFSAAIAWRVRMADLTRDEAVTIFSASDEWVGDEWVGKLCSQVLVTPADVTSASMCIRRLDLPLRAPDAVHTAASARLGTTLVTFDEGMVSTARALVVPVVLP